MSEQAEEFEITNEFVDAVELEVGMGAAAWDCVGPMNIIAAVLKLSPELTQLRTQLADATRIISELQAAQGIAGIELKRLREKVADLDAIEAAITAGEEPEPHIQRYKKLAKYMAGFRVINQQLIDDNAAAWNRVSVLTAEAKASKELAKARLRTIHGLNLKLKNQKQPAE